MPPSCDSDIGFVDCMDIESTFDLFLMHRVITCCVHIKKSRLPDKSTFPYLPRLEENFSHSRNGLPQAVSKSH